MKLKEPIKLIEGKFSPEDAKEILLELINHKINFHKLKNFSSEERFGQSIEGSKKRIEYLKKAKQKIVKIIDKANDNNNNLRLESSIEIFIEK